MPNTTTDLASVQRQLAGAWTLVGWTIDPGGGRAPAHPFGADATGLIVYTADGWMNATIARAGRTPLSAGSVRQAPVAEQVAAFESYFNYGGPYTLHLGPEGPVVEHAVRFSLNPNFVGSVQRRRIAFDGERRLTLSADEPVGRGLRRHRLDWCRS